MIFLTSLANEERKRTKVIEGMPDWKKKIFLKIYYLVMTWINNNSYNKLIVENSGLQKCFQIYLLFDA